MYMKKCIFLLFLQFAAVAMAQEPGNNLRKSLSELRASFPDLIAWGYPGEISHYKSPTNNILFDVKKDMVISEYTYFEGPDSYLRDLYSALISSFLQYPNQHFYGDNGKTLHLVFSYFTIAIFYKPGEDVSIMYELKRGYWP